MVENVIIRKINRIIVLERLDQSICLSLANWNSVASPSRMSQSYQIPRHQVSPIPWIHWAASCPVALPVRDIRTTCRPDHCPLTLAQPRARCTRNRALDRITATTFQRPVCFPASSTPSSTGISSRILRAPNRGPSRIVAAWGKRKSDRITTSGDRTERQKRVISYLTIRLSRNVATFGRQEGSNA